MLCPKRVWSVYILGHDNFILLVMPIPLGTPFRNSLELLLRTRQTDDQVKGWFPLRSFFVVSTICVRANRWTSSSCGRN